MMYLKDDPRIDQTTFFEDEMYVACQFKTPLALVAGLQAYSGQQELNKTSKQKKKEQQLRQIRQEYTDQQKRIQQTQEKHEAAPADGSPIEAARERTGRAEPLQQPQVAPVPSTVDGSREPHLKDSCLFRVFDRVTIRVAATETFPLDFSSRLLLSYDDMEQHALIQQHWTKRHAELDRMVKSMSDGTKI